MGHFLSCSFGTKPLSLTVSEKFNDECDAVVDMTLIRPLNKGDCHSFWYQFISHIRLPIKVNSNFCSRTRRLATTHLPTIHSVRTTDRRNTACSISTKTKTVTKPDTTDVLDEVRDGRIWCEAAITSRMNDLDEDLTKPLLLA